ncbi:hypothetical protein [Idiomarina sp. UBA4520]|jgi:hypothetical protein|uniref:hypothetical protein n=1 Tax=Idiomarina sp. UBA4520 TaxID=1946647 RepID=UPI000AF91322|nr:MULTISPECIES: hypothetical protein [unclassified Idiomarina]MBF38967.1 hypothetical protein [Idiomarinaceae bacterium]|tara:strand:+ start:41038 stop:41298 length:261 start_codon:yes stop_codon:yes gene_type:complete
MAYQNQPSQEWLDDQMLNNLSVAFSRYFLKEEGHHISKSDIQEKLRGLSPQDRVSIVRETIDEKHYPPSELSQQKLEHYIDLYLNS